MKKLFILFTILLLLIGSGAYIAYKIYYPKVVSKIAVNERYTKSAPTNKHLSATVIGKIDKVIASIATNGITFSQSEEAVMEVKSEDLKIIYGKLKDTKITSVEQVFDTISNNLSLNSLDIECLRDPFVIHFEMELINKCIQYIDKHDLFNTMDEQSARLIALQIIRQEEVKIKERLQEVN